MRFDRLIQPVLSWVFAMLSCGMGVGFLSSIGSGRLRWDLLILSAFAASFAWMLRVLRDPPMHYPIYCTHCKSYWGHAAEPGARGECPDCWERQEILFQRQRRTGERVTR